MSNNKLKYPIFIIGALIIISLLFWPNSQITGKQIISSCYGLSWWDCITTTSCDWNFNQDRCTVKNLDCSGLSFETCSATIGCRWKLDYNGEPFKCTCIIDTGMPYLADVCYNCQKDPMETNIDCGGICDKECE